MHHYAKPATQKTMKETLEEAKATLNSPLAKLPVELPSSDEHDKIFAKVYAEHDAKIAPAEAVTKDEHKTGISTVDESKTNGAPDDRTSEVKSSDEVTEGAAKEPAPVEVTPAPPKKVTIIRRPIKAADLDDDYKLSGNSMATDAIAE